MNIKNLFSTLYEYTMRFSAHRHASRYLAGFSFIEAIFFPVPVDVLLLPMALARPEKAYRFALIATIWSVIGGVIGYLLGLFFSSGMLELFVIIGWEDTYKTAVAWFGRWGVWVIFVAGFTPIPYKVFTVTAGIFVMPFIPFVIASFVGRGARYFLLALLVARFGGTLEPFIVKYMDRIGWFMVFVLLVGGLIYHFR